MSVFSIDDELIQGGPALIMVSEDNLCTIPVTNCAPYAITIKQGSVIGFVEEECSQGKVEPLSDTKVTEIFESIDNVCAHANSSHKWTRDEIAQKSKLNVPPEFQFRYLDLLYKHSGALSTSKTDLGKVKISSTKSI